MISPRYQHIPRYQQIHTETWLAKNHRLKPLLRKSTGYADKITHHFYIWDKVFIQLEKKPACQFVIFDLKVLAEIYKWFDKYLNRIFLYSIFILSTCDSLINQSCISPPSVKLFFINMFLRYNFMALNKILVNEYVYSCGMILIYVHVY